MSATYLVDGKPVELDAARRAFGERHLVELARVFALIRLRHKHDRAHAKSA